MQGAGLLRFEDVRGAYRLIGECRDLGRDPLLWQQHLVEGLCRLMGVPAATAGEGTWSGVERSITVLTSLASGLDEAALNGFHTWHRRVGTAQCPMFQALWTGASIFVTQPRSLLVSDREWYRSESYLLRKPGHTDHQLISLRPARGETLSALCLHRAEGERDFTERDIQLTRFFHGELEPLVGRALVSVSEPGLSSLSPRLRQTLSCLLEGDSEKQVAARLRLSPATAHQYVTTLYRHFGVRSRAQLLVHLLQRMGRDGASRGM